MRGGRRGGLWREGEVAAGGTGREGGAGGAGRARLAPGEKVMLSLVTLAPGAVVPEHAHPHEQMGMMVSGTMELTVAGETRTLSGTAIYLVPGGVHHKAVAGPE